MAKRRQTTGLPKDRQQTPASSNKEKQRVYKSRAEREAEIQRYVLIGTGVAVAMIVLILVGTIVSELFINPNQVVLTVNADTVNVAQFQERVRLERALLNLRINNYIGQISAVGLDPNQFAGQEPLRTWLQQVQIPDQLGNSVINSMTEDLLVRQQAAERGITVDQAAIDKQINDFLGFDPLSLTAEPTPTVEPTITPTPFVSPTPSPAPTATPTVEATEEATAEATEPVEMTPTATPFPPTPTLTADQQISEFNTLRDDFFQNITSSARISRDRLNEYFEDMALRTALRDNLSTVTNEVPHVNARHILVATEEEAQDIVDALAAGESFAGLAKASSTDTGSGARGGELGWAPVTNFVEPFAKAVEDAEIGAIVGPVQTEFGWHVIQVHARETRSITDTQLSSAKDREFQTWLDNLKQSEATHIETSSVWADNVPDDPAFVLTSGA